jgi:hypothetical protein
LPVLQAQLKHCEALTDDELRFATQARSGVAAAQLFCENLALRLRQTDAVPPAVERPIRK